MSAPTPPAVDPAVRAAILVEECDKSGHIYDYTNMLYSSENGGTTDTLGAQDPSKLPHITCKRCPKVWFVVEAPGDSYERALGHLRGAVTDHKLLTPHARPEIPGITRGSHGNGH
jgi:hypothetical protein